MLNKSIFCCYLLILNIFIVGCTNNETNQEELGQDVTPSDSLQKESAEVGYVIQKKETTFLFAPTWQKDLLEKYEQGELGKNYPDAIYVNLSDIDLNLNEIEVGQPIRVWFDSTVESIPPSGHAVKVEIMEK
ncbi:hypothetical protein GCM10011409_34640 [Lentibacillus populi]|uniref:DUF3221 domain-containing protein n=1 Tax=Lentibacillus populi TaxID=1827502 RepID=A0A9W5X6U4_9BACI|nr:MULTISPECIES: DUF3221 domain-containing protein [Bacillaceae]MBT2216154.1 DUF3221 domain-containing protein [Virgibacillus dakarensis]GGB54064.1 hypothetical protein GCM10011409_34640 [Lentibacillus populi]